MLADTNINTNNTNDRGTHLTQSPWNPVRFTIRTREGLGLGREWPGRLSRPLTRTLAKFGIHQEFLRSGVSTETGDLIDGAGVRHRDTTNLNLAGLFVWTELHPTTAAPSKSPKAPYQSKSWCGRTPKSFGERRGTHGREG